MPSMFEVRAAQKAYLFDLIKLKRDILRENNGDLELSSLDALITEYKTAMEEEDVALVEKNVAGLK